MHRKCIPAKNAYQIITNLIGYARQHLFGLLLLYVGKEDGPSLVGKVFTTTCCCKNFFVSIIYENLMEHVIFFFKRNKMLVGIERGEKTHVNPHKNLLYKRMTLH